MNIDYPLAHNNWGYDEEQAIARVMKSGRYTMGNEVKAFEDRFCEITGSKYAVMVNSGSSANLLIAAAMQRLHRFDRVILPRIGWSTTYAPWMQHGFDLLILDVDETLNINPDLVNEHYVDGQDLVMPVNLLGNPCDFDRLPKFMVEDNCESFGATYKDKWTGTFGMAASYSFFFSHHLSTMEGGMIVTDDPEIYKCLLPLRAHGWTRELERSDFTQSEAIDGWKNSYTFTLPGYCVRPLEMSGATGREQLKRHRYFLERRSANAHVFKELFGKSEICDIQAISPNSTRHSWFGFAIILKGRLKGKRQEVVTRLGAFGVETRPVVTGDILKQPMMSHYEYWTCPDQGLTMTERVEEDGFFIGNDDRDLTDKLQQVYEVIDGIEN